MLVKLYDENVQNKKFFKKIVFFIFTYYCLYFEFESYCTSKSEHKAVGWESEVHLNMAMKLQSLIEDIYKSLFTGCAKLFLPLAFPHPRGLPPYRRTETIVYNIHCISLQLTVFCVISRTTPSEGSFLPLHASKSSGLPRLSYLQNSSFFGATRLRVLLKGKGKASTFLE